MNNSKKEKRIKEKLSKEETIKLNYRSKLELIKQKYGVQFDVDLFGNISIEEIKFNNLKYKNKARNVVVCYDGQNDYFSFITYDIDKEGSLKAIKRSCERIYCFISLFKTFFHQNIQLQVYLHFVQHFGHAMSDILIFLYLFLNHFP